MAKKKQSAEHGPATPATLALTKLGISFTAHTYAHDPDVTDFGGEAVAALALDSQRVLKTLLADVDGELVVGIVPVAGKLDLKALAQAVGGKKAAMADPAVAERKTGYVVGGISPLGQRTRLRIVLDTSAKDHPTVFVSGGRRGFDIELAPEDLARAATAIWAPIGRTA